MGDGEWGMKRREQGEEGEGGEAGLESGWTIEGHVGLSEMQLGWFDAAIYPVVVNKGIRELVQFQVQSSRTLTNLRDVASSRQVKVTFQDERSHRNKRSSIC